MRLLATLAVVAIPPHDLGGSQPPGLPPSLSPLIAPAPTYQGHTAYEWAQRFRKTRRQLYQAHLNLRRKWKPTVMYAIALASRATGVSYWQMRRVSWCESRYDPFAVSPSGTYKGVFQLGWSPFGFSPFDPLANALSAAMTVKHDGSWRQWQCRPT